MLPGAPVPDGRTIRRTYAAGTTKAPGHIMPVTNVLERLNGEVKRRADVVGIFPNENAITRLVGAILLEQNDEYAIQKRYMSLESLATMSENPPIRLPAIAGA